MTTPEERIARYTEGVCADGAAILCDGNPMSISEVLDVLNAPSIGDADKPTEPGLLDYPTDDSGGLQPYDAWGGPDSGDADKQAQQAADAVGVTPHSDMRPFVEQAVKYALTHPAPADKQADGLDELMPMITWLGDAARYFEARPTLGEDMAHWDNVYNAENCRKIAALLARLAPVERERDEAIKSIADMAERFRAVNVSEAIKQTIGENVFALRERAEAAEAKVLALREDGQFLLDRLAEYEPDFHGHVSDYMGHVEPAIARFRAALEQASKAGGGA